MIWPAEDIWQSCVPLLPALTVEVLKEVDSTNSELMRRARSGQTDPVLLVAQSQTAGRGRLGRQWHAQAGDALTFSLGLMLHPADWSGLSLAVGLSVVESLDPQGSLGLQLKWPNDIWVHDKSNQWAKLAGILIETAVTQKQDRYCVIGVGINISKPSVQDLSIPAIGLREILNSASAPQTLARIAYPLLATALAFEAKGFAPLQMAFEQRDVLRDRPVTLSDGRQGIARGVDNTGVLRVETPQGNQLIHSAEVRVRPSIEESP
ncbi:MAG: biotin--[acetyl-CoA-carboxylase] ligase [Burkholderiales bacterium]|nr:biotin--[acetyl-CoA-carboxylase] ligase [Burkholderiales bacterium]